MLLTTDAEIGALYINARKTIYIHQVLIELGHLQKQMLI